GHARAQEPGRGLRRRARGVARPARAQGRPARIRTRRRRRARLDSPSFLSVVELYPAVDIEGGRVARATSAADPCAVVRQFARDGARWVHVVDLDRAFGKGENRELTRRLLTEAAVPIQLGGSPTSDEGVAELLRWGATRVVIGTAAAVDAALVARLLARHGTDRLAVGIDARDGRVVARGSDVSFALAPLELARRLHGQGARTVIYTDAA